MPRTKMITIKVTEAEHETFKKRAFRAGFSNLSEYIRWLVKTTKKR